MKINTKELVVFSLLGAILFASKIIVEVLPNIHPLAMLIIAYTAVFRKKAIFPILVFIAISGAVYGFSVWWVPYFYLWPLLWVCAMLIPPNIPNKVAIPVYMILAGLHGILYGMLYAPYEALIHGFGFDGMIAWIIKGIPYDLIHGISNFIVASLTLPVIKALKISAKAISL